VKRLEAAEKREVTIVCSYWRNPILPEVNTGYSISTWDYSGAAIDESTSLSLDAT
jgi:hypothetical protein